MWQLETDISEGAACIEDTPVAGLDSQVAHPMGVKIHRDTQSYTAAPVTTVGSEQVTRGCMTVKAQTAP